MALTNKLYHYKTKTAFEAAVTSSQIPSTGIAFIADVQQIWTHGTYFGVGEKYGVASTTNAGLCPQLSGSASQYLSGTGIWTDIPTALKTPNSLTISLNGTSQGAFDGSAAKSINITAASVGAAASTHTHTASQVSGLSTVATSGSYNDLSNKPTIPSQYVLPTASATVLGGVKVGSGLGISSGVLSLATHTHTASQVSGLATVATSGSYNDLSNKPTIPSVPSLSGGAAATAGQYVSGVTVSGHAVTVTKASVPTSLPCPGTLTFTGGASGSYNGSGNVSVAIPVNTDTHWTTGISAGASGNASNGATGNPYVKVSDNGTYRAQIRFIGSGATAVSSDGSGNITISSTNTDTNTTYSFAGGTNGFTVTPSGGSGQWVAVTPSVSFPNVGVTNGGAVAGQYVSAISTNGHGITVTRASLPGLSGGGSAGTGQCLTSVGVSGHTVSTGATSVMDIINTNSEITFTKHVTCSAGVANTSDIRYKTNRIPVEGVLEKLEDIDVFSYNWKNPNETLEPTKIGISAQQLEEKFGDILVTEENIQERETKVVDIPGQIAVLFAGMKELIAEVKNLKNENELLKIEIEKLNKNK